MAEQPQPRSRRRRSLVAILVVLVGAGALLAWAGHDHQRRLEQERLQQQTLLPRRVAAIGRVEPLDRIVKVSVPSSLSNDAVRQILVKEGQRVSKGQPLAILESAASLETSVREAAAAVAVAQRKLSAQDSVIARYRAQLSQAEVEMRRYNQLFAQGATSAELRDRRATILSTSQASLNEALGNRDTLVAELTEKRATLERDRSERAKATIRAPFAGTVFKINAYPGDKVGDDGIVEMGDSSRMGVIAEVYQTDRPGIMVGQRVTISADGFAGKTIEGRVVDIARQVSRQTVFTGQAGENLDRRVFEVKVGLSPESAAMASLINYLQVNVLFDPLTPQQRQQQQLLRQQLIDEQRRQQPGLTHPATP
jgi:HlyD family secretion protein